ncbi:MAG: hypothetical protein RL885_23095 [Planctomycetota bacterium]
MTTLAAERIEKSKRRPWLWIALATSFMATLVIHLPALFAPFDLDELLILGGIDETSPWMGSRLDLYRFSSGQRQDVELLVDSGALPWFTSSDWRYALWRPLTSLTFNVDFALFGRDRLGYQLHSVLWWLVLISIVGLLMFSIFERRVAFWSVLTFSLSAVNGEAVVWLSARHTLLATTLGLAGLAAHVHWRETRVSSFWRLFSIGCLLGALAASESALQCFAYLLAYEACRGLTSRRKPRFALRTEILILVGYLVLYRAAGRGASEAFEYVDAMREPGRLAEVAGHRASVLLGRMTTGFELGSWTIPGLAVLAMGTLFLRGRLPALRRRHLDWLVVGSFCSVIPALCGFPDDRALLAPSVGWAAVVGCGAEELCRRIHRRGAGPPRAKLPLALLGAFVACHLVVAPFRAHAACLEHVRRAESEVATLRAVSRKVTGSTRVICVNSPNWLVGQVGDAVLQASSSSERRWWLLSMTQGRHQLTRTGPGRFELSSVDLAFDVHYFRDPQRNPIWPGYEVDQAGLRVRVLESIRGWPTRIQVDLETSLEDPATILVTLVQGELRKIDPPSIGTTIQIPAPEGL